MTRVQALTRVTLVSQDFIPGQIWTVVERVQQTVPRVHIMTRVRFVKMGITGIDVSRSAQTDVPQEGVT